MNVKRQSKSVGYAIAALVFGVFGLILFWLPFVGAVISIIALALATVALIINLQEIKKEIIVFIALFITLISAGLSGKVTYKTTMLVHDVISSGTFQMSKKLIQGTDIYTDTNTQDIHIIIHKNQIDTLDKQFDNLEKIIEQLDSANNNFQ